jgi:lipopolysaccharide transport system ATP-binding protein
MSKPIISVENLGKKYIIGENIYGRGARTFRDLFDQKLRNLFSRGEERKKADTILWALKDVSFDVTQGEVVGIIGRNGAGKTTLLKVLSRITEPTEGQVTIRGRVASLLEVGTGFSGELTGRENIFLNGSILGMKKAEIKKRFDEIVTFAEVEKFIDTPMKRYSSGMYVRLAFAVAAHLEPEILLVDEVLAVGDAEFQKKCLGKMSDVAKQGRTVLFVSHNMAAVTRLCQKGILLAEGKLVVDSNIYEVTSQYLTSGFGTSAERIWHDARTAPGDEVVRLKAVRVKSQGNVSDTVDIRYPFIIEMEYINFKKDAELISVFSFINEQGIILFIAADFDEKQSQKKPIGLFKARCSIPGNFFAEGRVNVVAEVSTRYPIYQIHFLEFDSVSFQVVDKNEPGSVRAGWGRNIPGVIRPKIPVENTYLGAVDGIF